jgi:5-methylcytosine-specific restriction enzyme B
MDINFKNILEYLEKYSNKEYKNPEKASSEEEKDKMLEIKGAATPAVNEFKKVANYFKQIGFIANEGGIKWLDASNVKVRSYLWIELKKSSKEKYQSSISIFAEKINSEVRFRVTLELKEMGCKEEDYLRHHRFLEILDIKNNEFQYFGSRKGDLDLLLLNESDVIEAIKKLNNRELNKLQIGRTISKIKVDHSSNSEILNTLTEIVKKLEPFYNKAVEEEGDELEITMNKDTNNISENRDFEPIPISELTNNELILNIESYIRGRGFMYSYYDLANFYLSLKTKPFVILAGISGTGKSKLVRLFAEALGATAENGQFTMISVKPDWNDNTELFGYKNISDEFIPGKLTSIIVEALKEENRNKTYFVCLDEMNLARVEYYLSDYLSLIESREYKGDEIVTDKIFSSNYHKEGSAYKDLYLPDNLYLVGTVNMDDTTYAFSRKVLDRANTIEFSQVNLEMLSFNAEKTESMIVQNDFLKTRFLSIAQAVAEDEEYVKSINKKVIGINEILKKGNRHFGYRVRDEIVFYMLENKISGVIGNEDAAFDYVVMQKILPTISGSDTRIKGILIGLYNICNESKQIADTANYIGDAEKFLDTAKYKKSAEKIIEMLRGYNDGFTSYWL